MLHFTRARFRASLSSLVSLSVVAFFVTACGGSQPNRHVTWPTEQALPDSNPTGLETPKSGLVLRQATDGFLYAVGDVSDVKTGKPFYARYSGQWPLEDIPRPPLAMGHFVKVFDNAALVSLDYRFPETEPDGLIVTPESLPLGEEIGKGIAPVVAVAPSEESDISLSIGQEFGVQPGDIYAIASPAGSTVESVQISRRVKAICLVNAVEGERTDCRLWRGSSMVPGMPTVEVGDVAVFLEHTFGKSPRDGAIEIAAIDGDKDGQLQEAMALQMKAYLKSLPYPAATVKKIAVTTDARALNFHHQERNVVFNGTPKMVIGGAIHDVDGKKHLFVNYTGVGPASGPGMVAAPPERGVDLGPVDNVSLDRLRAFAGVVWSGLLVYRGQTSEALMHLRLVLNDPSVGGPLRWHARDQYAMRWAALGYLHESLWLVRQDEAMAENDDDETAFLNALGTRVRLYDLLDLPDRAVEASALYLKRRSEEKPNASYISALGMHAEMLIASGKKNDAEKAMIELREMCPDGCGGDLSSMLAGVLWATPEEQNELRSTLLKEIVGLARIENGPKLASARLYQGLDALRADLLDDALLAFSEAEKLFTEANYLTGVARTKYFMFITQLSRKEPQKAFEIAIEAIRTGRELRDFDSASLVYERLAALYTGFDPTTQPGPYLGAAEDVLHAGIQIQLAKGNFKKSADAHFSLGTFLMKIAKLNEAQLVFQRGVVFALQSARFETAALCHLSLGVVARERGDKETFTDEMRRALLMAEIANDPAIKQMIEQVLNPQDQTEDPTTLL